MEEGLRYNEGKIRYDLMHPFAKEQLAKVFTFGANKYAEHNWQKGMKWSKVLSSLHRHLEAIERGEDYDSESGLLHAAHVEWNAHALCAYYKIYPQGDDRQIRPSPKIGLDIDGVLADFSNYLLKYTNKNRTHPNLHWNDPLIRAEFEKVKKDEVFWSTIPILSNPLDIHFEPHCYITARSIDPKITQEWLDNNGFPKATLYCVGVGESKIEVAKKSGLEIFVDDCYANFHELTKAGIFTYLFDAPYNLHYNVGHKRIKSLKEL
jgi:uncharacterized HAD superfamily protein